MDSPLVSISVPGVFHAFDMAEAFRSKGLLEKIYSPRPGITLSEEYEKVTSGFLESLPSVEILGRLADRVAGTRLGNWLPSNPKMRLFDQRVARRIGDRADIFVSFPGACRRSLRVAQAAGQTTVVDADHVSQPFDLEDDGRGTNVVDLRKVLTREYRRFGRDFLVSEEYIRREIEEYRQADLIVVPTSFAQRSIRAVAGLPADRVVLLPYGVDTERFCPTGPSVDWAEDDFVVAFVGAVRIRKGVHYLLRAFRQADLEDAQLWIIGPHLEESARVLEEAGPRCRILGKVDRGELPAIYRSADVVVLPSVLEGFGIVLLEAMACGTPIIGTSHTAAIDLVQDGKQGFVLEPTNVDELAAVLQTCIANPEDIEKMGRAARKRSLDYTWQRYAERFVAAVSSVA